MFWHEISIKWKFYSKKVLKKINSYSFTLQQSHYNSTKKQNSWICFKDLKHAAPSWGVKHFPCESATLAAFSPLWSLTCDWRNQWCQVLWSWMSPAAAFHPSSFIARRTSRQDEGTSVIFVLPNQLVTRRRSLMSNNHLRDVTAPAETIRVRKNEKNSIRRIKSQTGLPWQTSKVTTAAQLASVFAAKPCTNSLNLAPISCTLAGEGWHSCPYMVTRRNRASDCALQFTMQQAANCGVYS